MKWRKSPLNSEVIVLFVGGGLQLATGRGELLTKINVNSIPKYLVLMNPGIHISTKEAYSNVSYSNDNASLKGGPFYASRKLGELSKK